MWHTRSWFFIWNRNSNKKYTLYKILIWGNTDASVIHVHMQYIMKYGPFEGNYSHNSRQENSKATK
jgi:hypothetical protein